MRFNKKILLIIVVSLLICLVLSMTACKKQEEEEIKLSSQKVYATTYSEIPTTKPALTYKQAWQEGMVGGNGRTGFITSGSPYSDTIIYQNIDFLMPTRRGRDDIADVTWELDTVRQKIINFEYYETASTTWDYSYKYHPGAQLRLSQKSKSIVDYKRWTDYETAEVGVDYTDENGSWTRSTFTSRVDNVTITKISQSSTGSKINMVISIDDASKMSEFGEGDNPNEKDMIYKELVPSDCSYIAYIAHYPDYELSSYKNGGYANMTYVITVGGTKERICQGGKDAYNVASELNQAISIEGAEEVYLITSLDRTTQMGAFNEFAAQEDYPLLNNLLKNCKSVAEKYTKKIGKQTVFSYEKALAPSAIIHSKLFDAASLSLGDTSNEYLTNEELLSMQKSSKKLEPKMVERVYKQGRYAMICNGGYTMSRLSGMWTGEWDAGWRSIYTMDANVNLQSSGMNTANIPIFGEGYINFVYRQMNDWITNANKIYGMEDALLCPVNTDGDRALNAEYYIGYPFQYWNAGAAWMIQPIYEYYQVYGDNVITTDDGDKKLLEEILLPLLQKNANFWMQLCTTEYYTDAQGNARYQQGKTTLNEGEKYLIIPSYSPENSTNGTNYKSTLAVNAAMDISAAKYSLQMIIEIENLLQKVDYQQRVLKYETLLSDLPEYTYTQDGALKEWCANGYIDNNNHRHISHLYPAWPAFETQGNAELTAAIIKSLDKRGAALSKEQGTQSHGWLHKGLVGARLKDSEIVGNCLYELLSNRLQYTSFMTDHNTDRKSKTYCTDSCYGLIGIIDEALVYSNTGEIEALPALPTSLNKGEVKGIRARSRATVDISWDENGVIVRITSDIDQTIKVSCKGSQAQSVTFTAGETKVFRF